MHARQTSAALTLTLLHEAGLSLALPHPAYHGAAPPSVRARRWAVTLTLAPPSTVTTVGVTVAPVTPHAPVTIGCKQRYSQSFEFRKHGYQWCILFHLKYTTTILLHRRGLSVHFWCQLARLKSYCQSRKNCGHFGGHLGFTTFSCKFDLGNLRHHKCMVNPLRCWSTNL